jgi:molybdopterin-guanine dinucleotide biosynthesis protein A
MRARIGGILLDGGQGTRLGAAAALPAGGKGAIEVGGVALRSRALSCLGAVAGKIVVVAAPGRPLGALPPGTLVVRDSLPGAGPLAALADGLGALLAGPGEAVEVVVLMACDLPLLHPALPALLVERLGSAAPEVAWVVPQVGGHPQVVVSALRPALLPAVRGALAAGLRAPRALLEHLAATRPGSVALLREDDLRRVDPDLAGLRDVDTPTDLEEVRHILRERGET